MRSSPIIRLLREARRRRVFRTAAIYIVSTWLLLQVADVLFPGFGIPDSAIQTLFWAAVLGFPIALVFGWLFDIGVDGIRRTLPAGKEEAAEPLALKRSDYLILTAFVLVVGSIVFQATHTILEAPRIEPADPASAAASDLPEKLENSIAVLPFANISNDPDNEYFCDGISEEILNRLGVFQGLNVIGRTSSFAFKGADFAIPKLSALLGARFLLQGSVRKHGKQLRISAQLLDEAGLQIWSESFDRELENVFAIQSEIADAVAKTVAPQIVPPAGQQRIPDIVAYEHYLKGREHLHARAVSKSIPELEQAIEIDPDFAEAHAELAIALLIGQPSQEILDRARQAIDTALALQPGLLRVSAAQGLFMNQMHPPDAAGSIPVLRRVLAQDPNMVDAINWLAGALNQQGLVEEAFEIQQRAVRIDPFHGSIVVNFAESLDKRGESEQAKSLLLKLLERPEPGYTTFLALREFYYRHGQLVDMNALARRQLMVLETRHYWSQALSYAVLGNMEIADYWMARFQRDFPDHWAAPYMGTDLPVWQGRFQDGVDEWRRALAERDLDPADMRPFNTYWFGELLALAGDCTESTDLLEPVLAIDDDPDIRLIDIGDAGRIGAWHALAWCQRQTGATATMDRILEVIDARFSFEDEGGRRLDSSMRFHYARNALLMGETDLALNRLEQAVADGWRKFYLHQHDPRWEPVREHPRYIAVMSEVKADVDAQRAAAERLNPPLEVIAEFDALVASRQNAAAE